MINSLSFRSKASLSLSGILKSDANTSHWFPSAMSIHGRKAQNRKGQNEFDEWVAVVFVKCLFFSFNGKNKIDAIVVKSLPSLRFHVHNQPNLLISLILVDSWQKLALGWKKKNHEKGANQNETKNRTAKRMANKNPLLFSPFGPCAKSIHIYV